MSEEKCREKTARGNVFTAKQAAKQAASNYSRKTGDRIVWFRCQFCRFYHVGGHRTPEERRRRIREAKRQKQEEEGGGASG